MIRSLSSQRVLSIPLYATEENDNNAQGLGPSFSNRILNGNITMTNRKTLGRSNTALVLGGGTTALNNRNRFKKAVDLFNACIVIS